MDLLTAVLACSLYADDALVVAISDAHSHGNPFAVVDGSLEPGAPPLPAPRSLEAALATLDHISSNGGAPLVGVLPIPPGWAAQYGRSPADLFDACTNVSIATAMLSNFDYTCQLEQAPKRRKASPKPPLAPISVRRRECVVGKYGEAIQFAGFEDLVVVGLTLQTRRSAGLNPTLSALEAPIFGEAFPRRSAWGANRVFFRELE